jgi:hypothetical protein
MFCVMHIPRSVQNFHSQKQSTHSHVGHDGRGRYSSEDSLKRTKEGFPICT